MRYLMALAAIAIVIACAKLTPPYDPHDYPCGPHGVRCMQSPGMCCDEGAVCCGDVGYPCPAGMCEYNGGRRAPQRIADAGAID